jgi:hypothetical protein
MPDLKELLRSLSQEQMPDMWDRIQRRPVEPMEEPRPSRAGAVAVAGLVALLTIGVVAILLPLGEGSKPAPGVAATQPPAWLVDAAYQTAYANGDITPDLSRWVLSDAATIAPALGLASGDPSLSEYLVELTGDFTLFPSQGKPVPKHSTLVFGVSAATHEMADLSATVQPLAVPGLKPFALPGPSHEYRSLPGWTIAVPPGWRTDSFSPGATMFSNTSLPSPPAGDPTVWRANLPSRGVALVLARAGTWVPKGASTLHLPLSGLRGFVNNLAATSSHETDWTGLVQGPGARYFAIVRINDRALPADLAAVEDMLSSLRFGPPSPGGTRAGSKAFLPSADAVVDGRFVRSVEIDNGGLLVDPAPAGSEPPVPESEVADELLASPIFQGQYDGVLGFGLVTLTVSQHGIETVTSVPAWVAFGWGGVHSCWPMTAAPSPAHLPSDGYRAVAIGSPADLQPFSYEAASDPCGQFMPTAVNAATHVVSVAWSQVGTVTNGSVTISYVPPPCGSFYSTDLSTDPSGSSFVVEMAVPDAAQSCPSPQQVTDTIGSPAEPVIQPIAHAPLGYVKQLG